MIYKDAKDFEEQTGFPAIATKTELVRRGGICYCRNSPRDNRVIAEYIRMQKGDAVYFWKRRTAERATEDSEFEIHALSSRLEQISFAEDPTLTPEFQCHT